MKKQFNVRLSSEALLAIKIVAKEQGCSEAEVIDRWATDKITFRGGREAPHVDTTGITWTPIKPSDSYHKEAGLSIAPKPATINP